MKVRKEVAEAEAVIARIRGKPIERDLIAEQEEIQGLDDEDESEEEDEDRGYRPICHTMDGHSSGSFVFTSVGFGINPQETTLTRFTPRKLR